MLVEGNSDLTRSGVRTSAPHRRAPRALPSGLNPTDVVCGSLVVLAPNLVSGEGIIKNRNKEDSSL